MKKRLSILFIGVLFSSCAVNAPYQSEQMLAALNRHEKIAVLPFHVGFNEDYKMSPMNGNRARGADFWREQERLAGLDMQKAFFVAVARQVEKGRFERIIQDFITTNKLLQASGVKIHEIPDANKGQLCRILGVDAVIWGQTGIVVNSMMSYTPSSGGATTVGGLYDGFSGELLWQKKLIQRPSNRMDTPKRLGNQTAEQLAKLLPY